MKLSKAERTAIMRNLSLLAAIKGGKAVSFSEATALEQDIVVGQFAPAYWGYPNGSSFRGVKLTPKANRMCRLVSVGGNVHRNDWHSGFNAATVAVFAVRESETFRLISVDLVPRKNLSVDFGPYYGAGIIDTKNIRYKDVEGCEV